MAATIFLHRIVRRHAHCIKSVQLDARHRTADSEILSYCDRALSLLPSFTALRALTLDGLSARLLFGRRWLEGRKALFPGPESFGIETFSDTARQVEELTLLKFTPVEASAVVAVWTTSGSLRRLRLLHLVRPKSVKDRELLWDPIARTLAGLRHLHVLEIKAGATAHDDAADAAAQWSDPALAQLAISVPPLTTLKLELHTYHTTDTDFINLFAATLKRLSITTDAVDNNLFKTPPPGTVTLQTSFTFLRRLKVGINSHINDPYSLMAVLSPFLDNHIVDLTLVDTHLSSNFHPTPGPIYPTMIAMLRTLKHLDIHPPLRGLSDIDRRALVKFGAAFGVSLPEQSIFDMRQPEDEALSHLCAEVDRVLEFGKRQVEWSRRLDDQRRVLALVEALKPLDAFRDEWNDL